jgi:hypothetical protein
MPVDDFNDPDVKVVYIRPFVAITLLAIFIFGGLALAFHEDVGNWIAGLRGAPADSIQGEWVGELDVSALNAEYIHTMSKHAVIRFSLKRSEQFLHKYGGDGEITIADERPLHVEVKDLWPSGTGAEQEFEAGIWIVPYRQGDLNDHISGGYEGTYSPGVLKLKRQRDRGYEMQGTLHKGTDQDYDELVQRMHSK